MLFRKKKREEPAEIPEFPRFPEKPEFPIYERQIRPLERPRLPPLPVRGPVKPIFPEPEFRPPPPELGIPIRKIAPPKEIPRFREEEFKPASAREEKPLFVKIEKYTQAINTINAIKEKLKEAEELLHKVERIREEEEKELIQWHDNINAIKEKLILVDERLFEV